jgi:hypothetical protein
MDASTRPPQKRHRAKLHLAACLVAVYFAASIGAHSATKSKEDALPANNPLLLMPAAHDIGVSTVKSGQEGLVLSARFSENGTELVRDVNWKIRNRYGKEVFNGTSTNIDAILAPDDYQIDAIYGSAQVTQGVTVHAGTKLMVSFVLNVGGLRILPHLNGKFSASATSHSTIYSTAGQLVMTSFTPGEIIKLNAGEYRIENRFDAGNVVAVTNIRVNAGRMSAVEINHHVGIATLKYTGDTTANLQWIITDVQGITLPALTGRTPDIILRPGHYKVRVTGQSNLTEFEIAADEEKLIVVSP